MSYLGSADVIGHVLDSNNPHDTSVAKLTDVDFTGSPGLAADDVLVFNGTNWVNVPKDQVGTTDHGVLGGLADDDHTQYHNDTRGDARYYTQTQLDTGQLDTRYYTESEVDTLLTGYSTTSHNHDLVYAPLSHTHVKADITDFNDGDYATAAQGGLADNAVQPNDNVSVLVNDAGYKAVSTVTVQTTDATPTQLASVAVASGAQKLLVFKVHGHEDATGDHIWKTITICVKNIAGTASIVGGADVATGYDAGATTWTIVAGVSSGNVTITVTGEAAHTIDWRTTYEVD